MLHNQKQLSLSVFFPAYNEEANIEATVRKADEVLRALTPTYEIIVVNDGSKDKTGEIADRLARENNKVKVVHHNPNQGYGGAVWSGIQAAQYEYVFFTDADLQFDLSEITKLIEHIPENPIVIGYRAKRQDPFMRLLNAKGWNILNRILFGLRVKDIDCAFKLMRRDLVKDLPVESRGAMLSAELLIRLQREGIKFKEVPVTHLPRVAGSPTGAKISVIIRAFKEMMNVYNGDLGNPTFVSIFKFGIVGVVNTLTDWIAYFALTRSLDFFFAHPSLTKGITFIIGTIPSFIGNKYWTFNSTSPIRVMEIVRFYITVVIALAINVSAVYVFVHMFNMYDLWAVVLATILSFIWNFIISKLWVFKSPTEGEVVRDSQA